MFPYATLLGLTVDTCLTSVCEAFGRISHYFSWWTPGDDFMFVSVFSAELGSTSDTCTASVCGAF